MFSSTGLTPGSDVACIQITYGGDLPARVKLYADGLSQSAGPDTTADLGTLITMDVEIGTAGSTCASFTPAELIANNSTLVALNAKDWSTGLEPTVNWTPDASTDLMRPYRFTDTLPSDNSAMGDDATIDFIWETQNTS